MMKRKSFRKRVFGTFLSLLLAAALCVPAYAGVENGPAEEIPAADPAVTGTVPDTAPEMPEEAQAAVSGTADAASDQQEVCPAEPASGPEQHEVSPAEPASAPEEREAAPAELTSGPEGQEPDPAETSGTEEAAVSDDTAGLSKSGGAEERPEPSNRTEEEKYEDEASGKKETLPAAEEAGSEDPVEAQSEAEEETFSAQEAPETGASAILAASFDNSTKLADGEYTEFGFSWEGGTGKARLIPDKIVVSGGKAVGYFTSSSSNMSHVYYLGASKSETDDKSMYDPSTGKCGEGVLAFKDKKVSFPVKLNTEVPIACRTTAMSVPHWVNYTYTITIDEETVREPADYSKVEAALAKVPKDLSGYKKSRVKALQKAIDAVVYGLFSDQQERVDAFASAIGKAVKALEKETLKITFKAVDQKSGKKIKNAKIVVKDAAGKTVKSVKNGVYELADGKYTVTASAKNYEKAVLKKYRPETEETVTLELEPKEVIPAGTIVFREDPDHPKKTNLYNTTAMFKVVKGALSKKGKKTTLTVSLSASGYHYLFKGTYEEALDNGLNKKNWIKGKVNADGKWEFVIPLKSDETFIPVVAVSQVHLEKVEAGEEELGDAIFARQLVLDLKKKTLTAGDYNAVVPITVKSAAENFKVLPESTMEVVGGPNSNNYACKPELIMADGLYTKAFIGTAENAAKDGAAVIGAKNGFARFRFEFVNSFGENGRVVMFEDKKPIAVAFYNSEQQKWEDYKLTIDKAASSVKIEALSAGEAPAEAPEQPAPGTDASGTSTSAVDASTGLADGTYTPDSFSFSGGTGKVIIVCDGIEVKGGQTYATIRFTKAGGGPASVDSLRANGQTYSGDNVFTIPVSLNKNNTIVARTTAMSQPHWIEYTIFIALAAAGEATDGKSVSENTTEMDEEAPAILGLKAKGEVETPYSDLLKIFEYEDGYYLIEVDAVRDTARDTLEYRTQMEAEALTEEKETDASEDAAEAGKTAEEEAAEEGEASGDGIADEGGSTSAGESISEMIAGLYRNEIVKYLVIPEGEEVPAGMDKEVIIVSQPADRTYISSEDAFEMIRDLGAEEAVLSVGMEDYEDSADYAYGGAYDKWDLKTFILKKINFAVQSSGILPSDEKTIEKDMDNLVRLGERSAQMDMAMFIDRSTDEASDLGRAEWLKVYGILFGKQEKAESLYKEAVGSASEKEKKDVEKLLEKRAEENSRLKKQAAEAAEKKASKEKK